MRPSLPAARRGGMTLVELLIVIVIITVLMAMIATSLRPAMENRKTREASRIVTARMARAKARAAVLRRPVAIWIQRTDLEIADPTCTPLSTRTSAPTSNAVTIPVAGSQSRLGSSARSLASIA